MKLLGDRILVKLEKPNPTGALLVINGPVNTGIVLLLGSGKRLPPELNVGGRVHLDVSYGNVQTAYQGQPANIFSIRDVLAILG